MWKPHSPCPPGLGAVSCAVRLSRWQAGWLGLLPVCVLSVCLCLGEVSRGPLPTWLSLSMQGPQSLHFVPVSACDCVSVCVCFLVLWPVCVCACVAVLWCL